MPRSRSACAMSAQTSRAATSSWTPWTVNRPPETSPGPGRITVSALVRDTTTVKPLPRSSAMVSSSTGSVTSASSTVCPSSVCPTAPGSSPPWPASRKTVRWRSPDVGENSSHCPGSKRAASMGRGSGRVRRRDGGRRRPHRREDRQHDRDDRDDRAVPAGAEHPGHGTACLSRQAATEAEIEATSARSSTSPSSEPSRAELARSGCGMSPTTLPASLAMPAMSSTDPFGFSA